MNNGDYVKLDHFHLHLYNSIEGRKPLLNMTQLLGGHQPVDYSTILPQ